jgi:hypothetical protein
MSSIDTPCIYTQKCYYEAIYKDYYTNNVEVVADVWNTEGNNIFPELCPDFVSERKFDPEGVSIAISGGGTRSYTCMIGYLRGLLELDVKEGKTAFTSCQFVSSVSGGSWITGTYLMAKSYNNYTDKELLGEYIGPENINYITLNEKNWDNETFVGKPCIFAPLLYYMGQGYENGVKTEFLWNYAIGKIFLERYNISDALVSQNEFYATKMEKLNPNLPKPVLPPKDAPFWICNASLLDSNLIDKGATAIQFTPLYSGFPQILEANSGNYLIGGIWQNTYAFGSLVPDVEISNVGCDSNLLKLKVPLYQGGPLTLTNMIGTSSAGYAYVLYQAAEDLFGQGVKFDPIYNFWCPQKSYKNEISYTSDGYLCDNSGILNLLARNCKYIIAFDNCSSSFIVSTDPITYNFCPSSLIPLFGLYNKLDCEDLSTPPNPDSIQVFDSADFDLIKAQFILNINNGAPVFARQKLRVLPNKRNGIQGGYEVDLLVISLQPSTIYNSLLPSNISSTFLYSNGPFPLFPNYSTIGTDRAEIIQLTKSQVNLLQCYCQWSIRDFILLKNEIIDMFKISNIY